ncbi:4-aminobutyrate--2-oxoglutarate transaminase [Aliikangiella coralliicola]|uniref:4-aminobutyrate--2-oxoglutarate transaminase n=1 Tax=Aliikangiella coralliicola TaxID=2592383 RepID=A0A545UD80_9GAMM|nr:4-aminobutyrate--2-oxoglutarate transaminase [Aliikangiella coralliicola]TQV87420.1 4-aminobutyrate--2-oxoglutarate transaminase [Aliikangiella coralliicola]
MTSNSQMQQRKEKVIAKGQGNLTSIYVKRAKNAELWDIENNRYIDFGSGIAVSNTGHSHPQIVEAVKQQLDNFSHTCVMVTPYENAVALAERLTEIAPGQTPKKAIFVTTGAEAVENCVKIARAHTRRRGIIAFNGGFHGRTNMTMGLTGKITPYKNLFGPFPNEIYHIPFPIAYHGISEQQSLGALQTLFKVDIDPSDVAAIIIEPVQGEGGFYAASTSFLKALRAICDQHGIVMIADEIQTGFARTGKMFCMDHHDIEPDLITMAKGIAGGFPLAAVVGKQEIMDSSLPGGLGGTYGGSPVGCAAALAVLDVIEQEKLVQRAVLIGQQFAARLEILRREFSQTVGEIRVCGAMIAIELIVDGDANQPNAEMTRKLVQQASQQGLILLSCGSRSNVIRFLPPLTISDELIDEGMAILTECFNILHKDG